MCLSRSQVHPTWIKVQGAEEFFLLALSMRSKIDKEQNGLIANDARVDKEQPARARARVCVVSKIDRN